MLLGHERRLAGPGEMRHTNVSADMKITVDIADPLLREAEVEAQSTGITLGELIETAIRRVLEERSPTQRRPFKLRDARNRRAELQPWIRPGDWEQMRDIAYGLDAIDHRRRKGK